MAPPQLITDLMRLMLLLAPSAAIICLVLAGLGLRQGSIPDALVGGNFAKWMFWAIVFLTLPRTHQLVSFVWSAGIAARGRHRYRMAGEPSKRPRELCAEFCAEKACDQPRGILRTARPVEHLDPEQGSRILKRVLHQLACRIVIYSSHDAQEAPNTCHPHLKVA